MRFCKFLTNLGVILAISGVLCAAELTINTPSSNVTVKVEGEVVVSANAPVSISKPGLYDMTLTRGELEELQEQLNNINPSAVPTVSGNSKVTLIITLSEEAKEFFLKNSSVSTGNVE
jgi:hypothetical protein